MIELVNLRKMKPKKPWDVRVDRLSPLGNPYKDGTRDSQCDRYEADFQKRFNCDTIFLKELQRLYQIHQKYGKLRLFCWYVPERCHSETIKKFLEEYLE